MLTLPMLKRLKNWTQLVQSGMDYGTLDEISKSIPRKPISLSPIALAVGRKSSDLYILGREASGHCLLIYADEFGALPNPVDVGEMSTAIAIDLNSKTLFVANSGAPSNWGNSVVIVNNTDAGNGTTPQPQHVKVGLCPIAFAVSEQHKKLYVANYGSANLTIIDCRTLKTITVALTKPPVSIAIDPIFDQIYVLHAGHRTAENESAGLTIIDGFSLQSDYLALPGKPHQMVMDSLRKKLYISDALDRNGIVFDVVARSFKSWPIGFLRAHLLINAWENVVYAHPAEAIDYVSRFDIQRAHVQMIPIPFTANAVAINSDSNELIAVGKRNEQATHFSRHQYINTFPAHEYGFITYHTKG